MGGSSTRLLKGYLIVVYGLLIVSCSASGPTPIFIDQIPQYYSLSSCAEIPLSQIVRNMVSGCGDGRVTTSYSCFCSASSLSYKAIISAAIVTNCPNDLANNQATSALGVFYSYCHLGPSTVTVITTSKAQTMTSTSESNTRSGQPSATVSKTVSTMPTQTTLSKSTDNASSLPTPVQNSSLVQSSTRQTATATATVGTTSDHSRSQIDSTTGFKITAGIIPSVAVTVMLCICYCQRERIKQCLSHRNMPLIPLAAQSAETDPPSALSAETNPQAVYASSGQVSARGNLYGQANINGQASAIFGNIIYNDYLNNHPTSPMRDPAARRTSPGNDEH